MIRREFLRLAYNAFSTLFAMIVLSGCKSGKKKTSSYSQLAILLCYLLYGDNLPAKEINKIEKLLEDTVQDSLTAKLEFDWLCGHLSIDKVNSFQTLSTQDKKGFLQQAMPVLVKCPQIIGALEKYLQKEHALKYLDYPDLPGHFGECGWLVLEGEVWDRYYPPSSG
jgi:hypothetical protein